jgi:hypothetical protein
MAKRSNRQTLLLPDVLWNELAIVAAQARKNRARFIREVLTAAVHGPSLTSVRASPPPKVVQMPDPRAAISQPARLAASPAPASIFEPSPPFDPEECYAAWLKSADQRRAYAKTKEQCAYYRIEWEPGQKPRPILVDANMEDDSIDANDGTDDIDADSAQEESEPNPDRTDTRPH